MAEALSETKDSQKGSVRKVGALGENKGKKFARKIGSNKRTQSSEGDAAKKSNTLIPFTFNKFKKKESADKSNENDKKKSFLDSVKDNFKNSRIIKAIQSKNLKSLEKCIERGFLNSNTKINGEKPALIAAKVGFDEGLSLLEKKLGQDGCIDVNEDGDTISTWAIKNNNERLLANIDTIALRLAKGDTNFHYGEIYRMIRDSRYSSETIEGVIHDSNVLKQDVKNLNGSNHLVFDAINSRGGKVVKALMKKGIDLDPEYKKRMNFKDICECFKDDKHEIKKWLKYKQEYLNLSSVKLSDLEDSFGKKVAKDLYYSTPGLPSYDYKYVNKKRNSMLIKEQKKRELKTNTEKKKNEKFMANIMEFNANSNAAFNSLPTPEALDNKFGLKSLQAEPIPELPLLSSSPKPELPTLPDLDINSLQFSADDMAGYDSIIGNSDGRLDIPDVNFNSTADFVDFNNTPVKDLEVGHATTDGIDPFSISPPNDKPIHKNFQPYADLKYIETCSSFPCIVNLLRDKMTMSDFFDSDLRFELEKRSQLAVLEKTSYLSLELEKISSSQRNILESKSEHSILFKLIEGNKKIPHLESVLIDNGFKLKSDERKSFSYKDVAKFNDRLAHYLLYSDQIESPEINPDDYKLSDTGLIPRSSVPNFNLENDNFMELKDTSLQSFDDNLNLVDKGGLESNIALFPQPSIPKINTESNFTKLKANLKAK